MPETIFVSDQFWSQQAAKFAVKLAIKAAGVNRRRIVSDAHLQVLAAHAFGNVKQTWE